MPIRAARVWVSAYGTGRVWQAAVTKTWSRKRNDWHRLLRNRMRPVSAKTAEAAVMKALRAWGRRNRKKLKCERCTHVWSPRVVTAWVPRKCPKCQNPRKYDRAWLERQTRPQGVRP